jgi:hypothetical protein
MKASIFPETEVEAQEHQPVVEVYKSTQVNSIKQTLL